MSKEAAIREATAAWFTPRPGDRAPAFVPEGALPLGVDFDGMELLGFTAGSGDRTVLLVHGWGSTVGHMQALVQPLVAAGLRVCGVDLPAHGASEGTETDMFELGRAVGAVAAAVGGVDIVIAHSIGAPATVEAIRNGLDLDGVVFVAPGTRLQDAFDVFVARAGLPEPVAAGVRSAIEHRFGDAVWEEARMERAAVALDLPGLIVHDPADGQAPIEPVRAVVATWPGARLVEVDGLGHNRILRSPELIDALIIPFVTELAVQRA
ncbi:MAG: alpha/beta fold hydrolase [Actinobacteria bacterium]|nr:MAG: alpha/beta fold hydrolase [Actinomycetota bacterium]